MYKFNTSVYKTNMSLKKYHENIIKGPYSSVWFDVCTDS